MINHSVYHGVNDFYYNNRNMHQNENKSHLDVDFAKNCI